MGVFGSTVPVFTLGSISKRWLVPGWRLGWLATSDPTGLLRKCGIADSIKNVLDPAPLSPTFIQAAVPEILQKTTEEFFSKTIDILRAASALCYDKLKEIPSITCPQKAEGSMFVLVKLNLSLLEDIEDDMEFCLKLAKEESLVLLPGVTVGLKNWLRITFAVEQSSLEDGLGRLKSFCERHEKKP
ncbi:TYROSINE AMINOTRANSFERASE [Salix koriyanagi]|uniref:TYROSINE AMINOTRANSFERASE n=1 Tax=Salix koriyanagi TaxID=2511006 RepID=A0A9Q0UPN0_9ROSI|nr:TYROSINE AMINOTRANSFERASE [Salix koriyanagi]